jgi:acyl-CoA reductase-like NAD-dependent aldehyde dehydrogenase
MKWGELIAEEAPALDALDAAEMGKPIGERFGSAMVAAGLMRFYSETVDKLFGDVYSSDGNSLVAQRLVPRGVIGAVVPWNFPTSVAALKIAPALAAGNTMVLKPSELSPSTALCLADLALRAGLPPGVLNVVPGLGEIVGRALGLHNKVDMITFTGSTGVGKRMLQYAGESNMKLVHAECGGKSPHIVFDDCEDLDSVADFIGRSLLVNQGQVCSVGSRLLVHKPIEDRLLSRIAVRFNDVVIGDALDPKTTFGPLVSARQQKRVMSYVDGATAEGAVLIAGGRMVRQGTGGFFVEPTLFGRVDPASHLAQEEVFGPVLAAMSFETESEAVALANGTIYGLGAYVWTSNLSRGMRVAGQIRSSVRINATIPTGEGPGYAASSEPAGQSGIGAEGGLEGIEAYMRRKRLWINHA